MTSAKFLLVVLFSGTLFAQKLDHPITAARGDVAATPRPFQVLADTIDVLAVAVQFQPDNESRTTGTGQFDLSTPAEVGFDSPPHNRQYFLDHLTFLSNYYRKVSKGKMFIRATLVDSVFTLASQMSRYSPPKTGPNTLVGDLARDTWNKVDSSGRIADFSTYECFVVFHAGAGRDIDIAGTVGYDPTPLDIPSIYIGLNAFKSFYGSSYAGIPVRGGFRITNTIIMPETETRTIPATPSDVLLRLGINGLLCASVGNYLGLPDLFNTNTGSSGIGRFGLMDGQSIFSFAGVFPPEPSAWEKYWLGWIQPITLSTGTNDIALPAASLDSARVYRIPISGSEYYLLENRSRDAGRNGQRITSVYSGIIRQQSFARDTTDFNAYDLDLIKGNVTDVEDFDWSLPGGVSSSGEFFDGGLLVWHIDEAVIARGLAGNGVNSDPGKRGVDLEEADGSQDIGQQYGQLEAGSGSEEGTALDFWYQGNSSPANIGEFSARSHPNNLTNSGANSHVSIKDFSVRGPRMTARVLLGDDQIALLPNFPKVVGNKLEKNSLTVADLGGVGPTTIGIAILVTMGKESIQSGRSRGTSADVYSKLFAWKLDGSSVMGNSDGRFARNEIGAGGFIHSSAVADLNGDNVNEVIVGQAQGSGSLLKAYSPRTVGADSFAVQTLSVPAGQLFSTGALVSDTLIAFGGAKGRVYRYRFNGTVLDSVLYASDSAAITGISKELVSQRIVMTSSSGSLIQSFLEPTTRRFAASLAGPATIGMFGSEYKLAFAATDGSLYLSVPPLTIQNGFPIATGAQVTQAPIFADVNGDGSRDIIVFAGNKIFAYNFAGAALDNFPKAVSSSNSITSNPVVGDVDGNGDVDIVAVTSEGLVVAYDKSGSMAAGFPLQAGTGSQSVALFAIPQTSGAGIGLAVASSDDGSVTAWKTGSVANSTLVNLPWPQYQHDAQHTGLANEPLSGTPISSEFFPKDRAYNWPNPVYEGKTYIRYFIKESATVKIKILDLAGDLVTEFSGPGVGGVDNEVEWQVAGVQSGVYLARIEANSGSNSAVAIVKVAVVK